MGREGGLVGFSVWDFGVWDLDLGFRVLSGCGTRFGIPVFSVEAFIVWWGTNMVGPCILFLCTTTSLESRSSPERSTHDTEENNS